MIKPSSLFSVFNPSENESGKPFSLLSRSGSSAPSGLIDLKIISLLFLIYTKI